MRQKISGCSNRAEREHVNLRAAIEAERHAHAANAAIHVELSLPQLEQSRNVPAPPGWKTKRTNEWQANLSAVCVAAQYQRNSLTSRVLLQLVDIVGCVAHQKSRLGWDVSDDGWDRLVRIRSSTNGIVETGKPDPP